jgi:hypothetical protein
MIYVQILGVSMELTKAKAVVAAIGTFVTALQQLLMDNILETNEWASLATSVFILAVTVYGVFRVPNVPVEKV